MIHPNYQQQYLLLRVDICLVLHSVLSLLLILEHQEQSSVYDLQLFGTGITPEFTSIFGRTSGSTGTMEWDRTSGRVTLGERIGLIG